MFCAAECAPSVLLRWGSGLVVLYKRRERDKCLATTPDELPDRVTQLGILQNGDMVLRTPNDSTGMAHPMAMVMAPAIRNVASGGAALSCRLILTRSLTASASAVEASRSSPAVRPSTA